MTNADKKHNYGNDAIKSLSDRLSMRLRPSNNLGTDDVQGAFHALKEIVDNSIDEVKSGFGDEVTITKHKDNFYSVHDSGRGVPMDWNNNEEKYNYELVFMTLNAGGKYNTEEDGILNFLKDLMVLELQPAPLRQSTLKLYHFVITIATS